MLKLLVNVPPHVAGAEVAAADLGEEFAAELVANGQAEPVQVTDPVDPVLALVFEAEGQIEAVEARLSEIVTQADSLDDESRARVGTALLAALRRRETIGAQGLNALLDLAVVSERPGDVALADPAVVAQGNADPAAAAPPAATDPKVDPVKPTKPVAPPKPTKPADAPKPSADA